MKLKLPRYYLEFTVFFSGAFVMAYEILASRILGPSLGTSIQVWTIIIGVFLLSISAGYLAGGKLADKKPSFALLGKVLLGAAFFVLASRFFYKDISFFIVSRLPLLPASLVVSLILFSVPAFLLGMVAPLAVKLRLASLNVAGTTVGRLYSLSTLGSIAGTILTGFYLIPHFPVSAILTFISLSLALIATGLIFFRR